MDLKVKDTAAPVMTKRSSWPRLEMRQRLLRKIMCSDEDFTFVGDQYTSAHLKYVELFSIVLTHLLTKYKLWIARKAQSLLILQSFAICCCWIFVCRDVCCRC